ncbi:MAG TPA: hypothetical protein VI564_03415 [Candidatus Nanoarchaeia archaeon]|nr:hypothetical protein [Candidatus Nanoarchaeia archaeon]
MSDSKTNVFEIVLLIVGVGVGVLGFQLINEVYSANNGELSWMMIVAIFSWLTLLVMFILLSLMVDVSKKELAEIRALIKLLADKQAEEDKKKK